MCSLRRFAHSYTASHMRSGFPDERRFRGDRCTPFLSASADDTPHIHPCFEFPTKMSLRFRPRSTGSLSREETLGPSANALAMESENISPLPKVRDRERDCDPPHYYRREEAHHVGDSVEYARRDRDPRR